MIIKLQRMHPTLITKGIEEYLVLRDYNNDKIRILLAGNNKISCLLVVYKTFKISRQYTMSTRKGEVNIGAIDE